MGYPPYPGHLFFTLLNRLSFTVKITRPPILVVVRFVLFLGTFCLTDCVLRTRVPPYMGWDGLQRLLIGEQPLPINEAICKLRDAFIREGIASSYEHINDGLCADFAELVCQLVPDAELVWNTDLSDDFWRVHCFIEYDGCYYDAECPEGVEDWCDLPFFQRCEECSC